MNDKRNWKAPRLTPLDAEGTNSKVAKVADEQVASTGNNMWPTLDGGVADVMTSDSIGPS